MYDVRRRAERREILGIEKYIWGELRCLPCRHTLLYTSDSIIDLIG